MLKNINVSEILNSAIKLSEEHQLELISKLSTRLLSHRLAKVKPKKWMEMAGLGAEIWKDIDAQEYINRERESWGE